MWTSSHYVVCDEKGEKKLWKKWPTNVLDESLAKRSNVKIPENAGKFYQACPRQWHSTLAALNCLTILSSLILLLFIGYILNDRLVGSRQILIHKELTHRFDWNGLTYSKPFSVLSTLKMFQILCAQIKHSRLNRLNSLIEWCGPNSADFELSLKPHQR